MTVGFSEKNCPQPVRMDNKAAMTPIMVLCVQLIFRLTIRTHLSPFSALFRATNVFYADGVVYARIISAVARFYAKIKGLDDAAFLCYFGP